MCTRLEPVVVVPIKYRVLHRHVRSGYSISGYTCCRNKNNLVSLQHAQGCRERGDNQGGMELSVCWDQRV